MQVGERVVRILPDVPAIDRTFDYVVPARLGGGVAVEVGTMVRIPLAGRRVGGWIVELDVTPPEGIRLSAITKMVGVGPSVDMIELCRWAAWRWSGRVATFLRMASPERVVARLGAGRSGGSPHSSGFAPSEPLPELFGQQRVVVRLSPTTDPLEVIRQGARLGPLLIITPSAALAGTLARRMRTEGIRTALHPHEWASAAGGGVSVIGARSAAFAPMRDLAGVIIIDEHDERLQAEGSPTWHARDVALERARRARVPAVMTSPCPTVEAVQRSPLITLDRGVERRGWPIVDVVDRRDDEPGRGGLYSEQLVAALHSDGTVLCVLNRVGRAQLLACAACGVITSCERCDGPMSLSEDRALWCRRCELDRPMVCQACGATKLKNLRVGVTRAREELEALVREPVGEITATTTINAGARVLVGTEALLHRVDSASVVAFLEFDQELFAPRYRAAEQALAMLARAARLVDGRSGRLVIQTRAPDHEVIRAAVHANPSEVLDHERARREIIQFPPAVTLAEIGGEAAPAFVELLVAGPPGLPDGATVLHPDDGTWLISSKDRRQLLDALSAVSRPPGRLRLRIDPLRLR